jgi:hypothetical protein
MVALRGFKPGRVSFMKSGCLSLFTEIKVGGRQCRRFLYPPFLSTVKFFRSISDNLRSRLLDDFTYERALKSMWAKMSEIGKSCAVALRRDTLFHQYWV